MDTTLTTQEEEQILAAIDDYASQKAIDVSGAKELFCEHWDTVKEVLEFLKGVLPAPIPAIINIIIKFGDIAHGKICSDQAG